MEELIRMLREGQHSLVVANGRTCTFGGRGVSDLYRLLRQEPALLRGALVADKVVGKAAAALMALAGVKEVYAEVVSRPALRLLEDAGLQIGYGTVVPHIINRAKTGMCPLETRCLDLQTPGECLAQIEEFMNEGRRQDMPGLK